MAEQSSYPQPTAEPVTDVPLVVDLDGTLVRSDMLVESVLALLCRSILYALRFPGWLMAGKARLKREVASRVQIDPATLPYNQAVIDFLGEAAARGRPVVLATAADRRFADEIAQHLGLFSEVFASDGSTNLAGARKLHALRERFGDRGFDYMANSRVDLPVWAYARRAILVGSQPRVITAAAQTTTVEQVFPHRALSFALYARAVRAHQWLKNLLLFVPLIAAHELTNWPAFSQVVIGFLAFCLCASSVYLLNDLLDLQEDRSHPHKRERPLASGRLPLKQALMLVPSLLIAALLAALMLPWTFLAVLAGYYALTLAYSLGLKRLAIIDVLVLAMLYTIRVIAGGAAGGIELSFWLLAFSVFVFLSLALAKRCAELALMQGLARTQAGGRGYLTSDLPLLYSLGGASGYVAVLVLALYINSERVAESYARPELIWLLCPVMLYWISRMWLKIARGQMHDDPVLYAVRDTGSRITGLVGVVLFWLAI